MFSVRSFYGSPFILFRRLEECRLFLPHLIDRIFTSALSHSHISLFLHAALIKATRGQHDDYSLFLWRFISEESVCFNDSVPCFAADIFKILLYNDFDSFHFIFYVS